MYMPCSRHFFLFTQTRTLSHTQKLHYSIVRALVPMQCDHHVLFCRLFFFSFLIVGVLRKKLAFVGTAIIHCRHTRKWELHMLNLVWKKNKHMGYKAKENRAKKRNGTTASSSFSLPSSLPSSDRVNKLVQQKLGTIKHGIFKFCVCN